MCTLGEPPPWATARTTTMCRRKMRGHDVCVVSRKQALSRELAAVADEVRYLDDLELVA